MDKSIRMKGDKTGSVKTDGCVNRRPSERTVLFILGIVGWLKDIIGTAPSLPHGKVFQHIGKKLTPGKELRFPTILLVEDHAGIALNFIEVIKNYYAFGTVQIFVAHTYKSAVTFFENEVIALVIMDADLDDVDGDGAELTQKFSGERPEITILANSSSKISNLKLTGFGASESLGKSPAKLKDWLFAHDPAGQSG